MSTSKVDQKYRIVVDKKIRKRTKIKAGDTVVLEPVDDNSFRVNVLDFVPETLESDPVWQAIHKPAKAEKRIPPEELEEIMEETTQQE